MGLAAVSASCSQTDFQGAGESGKGGFAPDVTLDSEILIGKRQKAPARAEASDVTAADLGLRLVNDQGAVVQEWDNLAAFDKDARFDVGNYTLEAFYGDQDTEGFEAPYFYGSQSIKIEENKVTTVALTAQLANAMVSLDYTDNFTGYMTSWSAEVHSQAGSTSEYAQTEARPVYVKAGLVEVYVSFTKPNGVGAKILAASFTAKERTHYHVTFDLNAEASAAVLKVVYDEQLNMEDVDIDLSDEILNLPAPVVNVTGFTSGQAIHFVPGYAPTDQLKLDIIARGKLARVNMTTHSASLLSQGWPAEVNLVNLAAGTQGTLTSLGLSARGLYNNPDKMAIIDLTKVLEHITLVDGDDGQSTISFVVVDAMGKASEEVTLALNNAPLAVSLTNPGTLYLGGTEMDIDLNYNGGKPEGAVSIQYKNDRGTWTNASAAYNYVSDGLFSVALTGLPATTEALILRATANGGKLISEQITVERTPVTLTAAAETGDVFATKAAVSAGVTARAAIDINALIAKGKLMLSTNGSDFTEAAATVSGDAFVATGLAPATTYTARIEVPGVEPTNAVTFTTEAAAQLPNADMESWYSTDCYGKKTLGIGKTDIKCWFPNASGETFWATRNPRTTGQTSGTTCYYTSFSGTVAVSGVSGNAAEISTLGYGEGTTYTHTKSGVEGSPKKSIGGMLFIGDYSSSGDNETISYGKPFTSRPSALNFKYKFTEVNGESFRVTVILENRDNGQSTEIGRGEFSSNAAKSAFTDCTVPVTYIDDAPTATHITVIFESTTSDSPKVYSRQGSNNAFQGYADSKYIGTQLTVDDITLIY